MEVTVRWNHYDMNFRLKTTNDNKLPTNISILLLFNRSHVTVLQNIINDFQSNNQQTHINFRYFHFNPI